MDWGRCGISPESPDHPTLKPGRSTPEEPQAGDPIAGPQVADQNWRFPGHTYLAQSEDVVDPVGEGLLLHLHMLSLELADMADLILRVHGQTWNRQGRAAGLSLFLRDAKELEG